MIDAEGEHDYSHDSIGRLLSATHPGAGPQPNESYVYDAAGNRLSSHLSVAYDYSNLTSGAGNRLMQDAQFAYAYDNEGNLVEQIERSTGALTTYTYDFRNRLTSIVRTTAGGLQTDRSTFVYDALNRRIRSTENGQTSFYTYDVVNPVLKLTGAATVRRLYGRGADRILADESAGAVRWYLTDQVGTVRDLVSSDATVLEHYVLDSFGRVVAQANHANNDLLVSGREHSTAHGLEYFRARFYDARNGRFLSEDPLYPGQYTYVGNRPLTATDPLGLMIIEEAELDNVAITFGHGARHLLGTSLTQAEVEAAIEALIREILANGGTVGGSFWLRLEVQGIPIIARAYVVAAAWISVGTYYPI
jgi:RHS repeat-associated protein